MNESEADFRVRNCIESKSYSQQWHQQSIKDDYVQPVLDKASKSGTREIGRPDFIYKNEQKKLLILIENKSDLNYHVSKNEDRPIYYAVDGVKHYLSHFTNTNLLNFSQTVQVYFENWNFIGIACSGDIENEYDHLITTFIVDGNEIRDINKNELLNEKDYIAYFENVDYDQISKEISTSSETINRLLRNLDSQKRPVLLSALMICLYPDDEGADFRSSYSTSTPKNINRRIPTTIKDVLLNQGIPESKINVLTNELAFLKTDHDLNQTEVVRQILKELQDKVIPLFDRNSSFDIIGRFYEEFLRYAGITNVKNGIVLTPNHIRTLFTDLIDIKTNDVILDPACGTGGLLISAMLKLENVIKNSQMTDKDRRIRQIKENQLIGIEKNSTMYSLAVSNMLFRGDGKSHIHNEDFFSHNAESILDSLNQKPTIGLVNPPYAGGDTEKNPTKKEIQFIERMLDNVSRFGVVIAPLSCYLQNKTVRDRILDKHTLKYVINMPIELFQPNASTATAIAVFETHKPHNGKDVLFYDLNDDGFVTHKVMGAKRHFQ